MSEIIGKRIGNKGKWDRYGLRIMREGRINGGLFNLSTVGGSSF